MAQESKNDQLNNIARAIPIFALLYNMSIAEDRDENDVAVLRDSAKARFPEYAQTVDALQIILERVYTSRKLYTRLYPGRIERLTKIPFINLNDDMASDLLATILWGRSINSDEGWISSDTLQIELSQIRKELGPRHMSPNFTYQDVLTAILSRDLKLKRRTPNQ